METSGLQRETLYNLKEINSDQDGAVEKLLNQCFGYQSGSFYHDFPVWDPKNNKETIKVGAFDGGQLIGTAGGRIAFLKAVSSPIKVGLVGAVATAPSARGKGVATQLVKKVVDEQLKQGVSLIFLWGSEHKLYQKIGFELCGTQVRVPIKQLNLSTETEKLVKGFSPGVFRAMQSRRTGLALDNSDFLWMSQHRNTTWYWMGEAANPSAYLAFGRGIDLKGIIHEWGGAKDSVSRLLNSVSKIHPEAQIIGSEELFSEYGLEFKAENKEFVGMCRVVNPQVVFSAFNPGSTINASIQNGKWEIYLDKEDGFLLNDLELAQFIFGPHGNTHISDALPLPIWIWGLDAC